MTHHATFDENQRAQSVSWHGAGRAQGRDQCRCVQLCANITNEAVAELGLQPGRAAVALIKSSMVLLSPDQDIRISARNRLDGTVSAIIRGAVNCEVKLRLGAERVLTAIITEEALKELDLAVGRPCTALIKASHVLIAVND